MTIVFFTNDLMFSSRVAGAAAKLGATLEIAGSAQLLLEKLNAANGLAVVVLDLNAPAVDPLAIVPKVRAAEHPPRATIAYGPHVHEQRLEAAKVAGCDAVFSRGQFDAQMDAILGKWLSITR